jgi:hypothetical protein
MLSRQLDAGAKMRPLIDRLVELHRVTDPHTSELGPEQKGAYAREAIRIWWKIYDRLLFWAQCELVGQDLMRQRPGLLAIWRDRSHFDATAERHFAEALGYRFSIGGRVSRRRREELVNVVGEDQLELLKFLAKTGLSEPGKFVEELFLREDTGNRYLRAELRRGVGRDGPMPSLTEMDLDPEEVVVPAGKTQWKLEALRQVRFLVGRGRKKIAALSEVAEAISHPIDALQEWERDLVKFSDYENDLYCAELVGEFEDHFRASHYSNIRNYRHYGSFEGVLNMERAANLARKMRHVRIADIRAALRNVA